MKRASAAVPAPAEPPSLPTPAAEASDTDPASTDASAQLTPQPAESAGTAPAEAPAEPTPAAEPVTEAPEPTDTDPATDPVPGPAAEAPEPIETAPETAGTDPATADAAAEVTPELAGTTGSPADSPASPTAESPGAAEPTTPPLAADHAGSAGSVGTVEPVAETAIVGASPAGQAEPAGPAGTAPIPVAEPAGVPGAAADAAEVIEAFPVVPAQGTAGIPRRLPNGGLLSNRYRLISRIAAGGMGEVWRATDELLGRPVAVKLLSARHAGDEQFRTRFRAEARYAASLSHPGIAQVFDYGESDPNAGDDARTPASRIAYLVMELVEGEPLSAKIARDGPMQADATLDLVAQSAKALAVAHAAGIVHRDIKPGNLLIRPDGQVKVTDFGIARATLAAHLTQTGMVMGTAQYVSPEQASARPVTAASDIYSLGVVAYECLAGRPPFVADAPIALALAHVTNRPPALPASVPPRVAGLIGQMLAKEPTGRPASAQAVADRASALIGAPSTDEPDADTESPWIVGASDLTSPAAWFSEPRPTTPVPVQMGTAPLDRRARARRPGALAMAIGALIAVLAAGTIAILAASRHPAAAPRSSVAAHQVGRPARRHRHTPGFLDSGTFPATTVTPSVKLTRHASSAPASPSPSLSPTSPSPSTSPPASSTPPVSPTPTPSGQTAPPPPQQEGMRSPNTMTQDG